jgi:hypothetical protein
MNERNTRFSSRPVRVGFPLGFAIFVLPIVFAWVTLMRGYSRTARVLSFLWLGFCVFCWVVGSVASTVTLPDEPQGAEPEVSAIVPEKTAEELAIERKADLQREYERDPEKALTLDVRGTKGGFETVLLISGSVSSAADFDVKDVEIVCELFANSGTRVGRVSETLYEVIPANGTKRFSELNMGFMGGAGQVATFECTARRAAKA